MGIFKKVCFSLAVLVTPYLFGQGQLSYWDFSPYVGTLNSSGDVATQPDLSNVFKEMRPQFGVQAEYYFGSRLGVGVNLGYGWIYAADANHTNPSRGLEVHSNLASAEMHFTINLLRYGRFRRTQLWAPYIMFGGGASYVQAYNTGSETYPVGIEYVEGTTLNGFVDFAIGSKFKLSLNRAFAIELYGAMMPSDLLEGFTYPGQTDSAADYYGGIRIRYSFLTIMKRGTY